MSAPASTPGESALQRTAHGTLVGMPPMVRTPHRLGQQSSTTLRSVYSAAAGPCSDAFHPERWSTPPPIGLDPIIPCDEPEEEESEVVYVRTQPPPAADERTSPSAAIVRAPVPEPFPRSAPRSIDAEAVTLRRPNPVLDEPVRLPFGQERSESEQRLLVMAALASATTLAVATAAVLAWL